LQPGDLREVSQITHDRSGELTLGRVLVSVPRDHEFGRVESPGPLWRFFVGEPAEWRHFMVREIKKMSRKEIVAGMKESGNSVLLFIHG
jgi:hypothetical protein